MAEKCKDCGSILPRTIKVCSFCEKKKFTGAAKKLFGILKKDVQGVASKAQNIAAKAKKIRIKIED